MLFDENGMLKPTQYIMQQKQEVAQGRRLNYTLCKKCGKKYSLQPMDCNDIEHTHYYAFHKQ